MSATCPPTLAPLGCGQLGAAFTSTAWNRTDTTIQLRVGGGAEFPAPTGGQSFWLDMHGCDCCARVKVTGRVGDVLTVVPPVSADCLCIGSNTRVTYAATSPEHVRMVASEIGINVVSPLRWDCTTRTLSLDCAALKDMVNMPCGT